MIEIIFKGGPTMIPLIVCSIVVLAIALERYIYLKKCRNGQIYKTFKKAKIWIEEEEISKALKEVKQERGPVATLMATALVNFNKEKDEFQKHLQIVGENEVHKMERHLKVIDLIAMISPLLGLLGTVIGIIQSFNILAGAPAVTAPAAISRGIAQALISTATGLIVAIPAMIIYSYLVSLLEKRTNEMNQWSVEVMELYNRRDGRGV